MYYKLQPEIITNYVSFIVDHENPNCTLLEVYYKLRQKIITNYGSFITNYNSGLLQITAKIYYKLRQKVIRNYDSSYF